MTVINLDPTTTDPSFLVTGQRAAIYRNDTQVVKLLRPAFASSIHVDQVFEPGVEPVELDLDSDYTLGSVDDEAMSEALLADPDFTEDLVSEISFTLTPGTTPIEVGIHYASTRKFSYPVNQVTTEILDPIQVLEVDLDATLPANYIEEERHTVVTTTGKVVIRPANGSFYHQDLVLVDETNAELQENVDYLCFGVDIPRTNATNSLSPVYNFIWIIKPMVGVVKVTYRAYGGVFTDADGLAVRDAMAAIVHYLSVNRFLTYADLEDSGLFNDYVDKLASLETRLQYLWIGGLGGRYTTATITATDSGYHWLPIASLLDDKYGDPIFADGGVFRVFGLSGIDLDLSIRVDYNRDRAGGTLRARILHGLSPINVDYGNDYSMIPSQLVPVVRIVDDGSDGGAVLQIYLPVPDAESMELLIENRSTPMASWQLADPFIIAAGSADASVTLPGGGTWNTGDPESRVALGYRDGVFIFGGAMDLDNVQVDLLTAQLGKVYPAYSIQRLEVGVYDRYTNSLLTGVTPLHPMVGNFDTLADRTIGGTVMFYPNDLCTIDVSIVPVAQNSNSIVRVKPHIGTYSLGQGITEPHSHRFQLVHIKLHYTGE